MPRGPTSGDGDAVRSNDRVAKNEALFRDVNDRILELAKEKTVPGDEIDFLCDSGREQCLAPIAMRLDEYELLRSSPVRFAVVPGHETRPSNVSSPRTSGSW